MTGLQLRKLMEDNHMSLQTALVRVACILDRPVGDRRFRNWLGSEQELDPKITEHAILNEHDKGFVWERS